jgi:GDPmannose 4,6-dehydratase
MSKSAFITGITGQDGAYLAKLLLEKGYKVYGGVRRTSVDNMWRLKYLNIDDKINLVPFDLLDSHSILLALQLHKYDEFYNLAAMSFVGTSFEAPLNTTLLNGVSVVTILDWLRKINPECKFYQASTSEMFGNAKRDEAGYDENVQFYPRSPYGVSKVLGYYATINFRDSYNMYACNGILFNHESVLRGEEFVTKKIVKYLASYKLQKLKDNKPLQVGNIKAHRDWGYAPEFVELMWKILQQNQPDDYVIGTGIAITVEEFLLESLQLLEIDYEVQGEGLDFKIIDKNSKNTIVEVSEKFYRPAEVDFLKANASKATQNLGWKPNYVGKELIKKLVVDEIDLQSR